LWVGDKVVGGVVGVKKGEHVLPLSMDFVCEAVREVAWGNGGICPLSKPNAFGFQALIILYTGLSYLAC
jgi:3-deoxy-D-manno-octulosonic acid (KDO) 8-phosphate synthase